jgi:hypothetical protein
MLMSIQGVAIISYFLFFLCVWKAGSSLTSSAARKKKTSRILLVGSDEISLFDFFGQLILTLKDRPFRVKNLMRVKN